MMEMKLRRPPAKPLQAAIESMAYFEKTRADDPNLYLDLPTTHSYLTFHLGWQAGKLKTYLIVTGSHLQICPFPAMGRLNMGARVRPGFLKAFLGVPASEIRDRVIPLEALWGSEAEALIDQMVSAHTPETRLAVMEKFLTRQIDFQKNPGDTIASAARIIEESRWRLSMAELAAAMGHSQRQLERTFKDISGFTPKEFFKTLRCRRVIQRITHGQYQDWVQLAHDFNYFDQSHLIREFTQSMKQSPETYRARLARSTRLLDEVNPEPQDNGNIIVVSKNL